MNAAPHPCARCRRLVVGRCQHCRRELAAQRDKHRPTSVARGYSVRWATYSKRWLVRFPYCGQRLDGGLYPEHSACVRENVMRRATITDHIVAIRDGGAVLDPANHQSLCASCNVLKDSPRAKRNRGRA